MSETAQLALIAAISTVGIPAVVSCFLSYMAYKKSQANSIDLKDLRVTFNGHVAKLVAASNAANRAEGKIEGMVTGTALSADDAAAALKLIATAAEAARELIATAERLKAAHPAPEPGPTAPLNYEVIR